MKGRRGTMTVRWVVITQNTKTMKREAELQTSRAEGNLSSKRSLYTHRKILGSEEGDGRVPHDFHFFQQRRKREGWSTQVSR